MEYQGRKVKVELHDGSIYDGFVHSYNTNIGKLSLEKVTCLDDGERKKLLGLQHFFRDEIADIIAEEEVIRNKSKGPTKPDRGHSVLKGKCYPAHLNQLKFLEPASLILKNQRVTDGLTSSGNDSAGSDSEADVTSNKDFTILPKTNALFYEAIAYIKKHHVVGMAMEGVSIGREGQLCWIQIAVPDHVFLFDMLRLGQDGFDEGLASIVENEDILKVIHNCRMMSDMLHHQYNISLVNVFDTQVANVFIYRLWNHSDWPRHVEGLANCLVQHLDLTMEEVNWTVVRERFRESDEEVWLERPPRKNLVEALVKNVKHLITLRQVLMEKMMEEFVAGVNIYLSHVRDASQGDARKYQKQPHLLPMAFQDIRQYMMAYAGTNRCRRTDTMKDRNGFRENCSKLHQPDVFFSRHSLWHAGSRVNVTKGVGRCADTVADVVTNSKPPPSSPAEVEEKPVVDSNKATMSATPQIQPEFLHSRDGVYEERQIHSDLLQSRQRGNEERQDIGVEKADPAELGAKLAGSSVEEEGSKLTGTSLMRALIQEQSPAGAEDHSDLEVSNITPAGKMITKPTRRSQGGRPHNRVEIPDIDLNKYKSTGEYKKRLTEQERRMVARMGRRTSLDEELWEESDSVLAQPRSQTEREADRSYLREQETREPQSTHVPSSYSVGPSSTASANHSASYHSYSVEPTVPASANHLASYQSSHVSHQNSLSEPTKAPTTSSGIQTQNASPSRLQALLALVKQQNG